MPRSMPDASAPSKASLLGKSWRRVRRVLPRSPQSQPSPRPRRHGHPLIELGEDEPRGRIHFEVPSRKHLWILWVAPEREAIGSSDTQVLLALKERHAEGLGRPPSFQELRLRPCVKDDMRRRIERAGDDEFTVARPLYDRFVLRGALSVLACCIRLSLLLEFLNDLIQRLEALFPDVPITIEPVVKLLQRLSAQTVEPLLRARLHLHQAHILEDLEVLRSLRLPELEPDMDVVHRPGPARSSSMIRSRLGSPSAASV